MSAGRRAALSHALLGAALIGLSNVAGADTTVNTDTLRLSFDARGNLGSAIACFPACSGEQVRVQQFGDQSVVGFAASGQWQLSERTDGTHRVLEFAGPGGAVLSWRIPQRGYQLELEMRHVPALALRSGESFRPREAAGFGGWLEQSRYAILHAGEVRQVGFDEELDAEDAAGLVTDGWAGYRNRFWTLLVAPPRQSPLRLSAGEGRQDAELTIESPADGAWSFYLGPVEPTMLESAEAELSQLLYGGLWFWLRWICLGLFHLLGWIKLLIPSWGLAIMVLSLAVNILMLPLSRIAERFQQDVNETEARLAPELQRIKRDYKGEEQAAKILALYKFERVHPLYSLKSMLGVAVVIPVFIGAFDMLAENIHLLNTGFLWITDLSRPDDLFDLPFSLPFFGAEFNLLPVLMTGLSFIASMLHNPLALNAELRGRQVRNMILLAAAFFLLFYTFPAGMVLYWTTNNLISVIKSLWARR
jgi:YidC/Oxa1 family membrane protein insertase